MVDRPLPTEDALTPVLDKFHEIELVKIFDAILSINSVRTQLLALFSTLNVAVVTLAFSTQRAGLLVFGAVAWVLAILSDEVQREVAVRFFFRAFILQRRYAPGEPYTYLTAYFQDTIAPYIADLDEHAPPAETVRALRRITRRRAMVPGNVVVVTLMFLELALGLYLLLGAGWKVF